jgi:hypothetical protein
LYPIGGALLALAAILYTASKDKINAALEG